MTIRITNTGIVSKTWAGQEVAAGDFYDISTMELQGFANSGKVFTDVGSGLILVSDGVNSFTDPIQGWAFIIGNLPTQVALEKLSPVSGRPEFIMIEAEGSGEALCTHNFMDRTTWYQASLRITGEIPTLDTGKIYDLANPALINSSHGKITFEDELNGAYDVALYDDGVEITQDTDYTVDFTNGKITIDASYTVTGALTIDYSYENGSTFTLSPTMGKMLSIKDAEIQFSADLTMQPIIFEIWAYNPADLPNKVPVFTRKYKNIRDIINVARGGKGVIPRVDVFTQDIFVFPFAYDRKIVLQQSMGMELRVRLEDDIEMGGMYGTMTFYVIDEMEI